MAAQSKPTWNLYKASGVRMTAHRNGQWCKKIAGKIHYFGPWADPEGALRRYRQKATDLHAGEDAPTSPTASGASVEDVCDAYLASRESDVVSSRERDKQRHDTSIGPAQFHRYRKAGEVMIEVLGANREADTLRPIDWNKVKTHLAKKYEAYTVGGMLTDIKAMFTWSHRAELVAEPPRFGPDFEMKNKKRAIRRAKRLRGEKFIEAETIRKLLAVANPQVAACVLAGVNCAFYSADCSDLVRDALHLDDAYLDFARYKTDVDRLCTLWPETINGLRWCLKHRPAPADAQHKNRVFLTQTGKLWSHPQAVRYDDKGRMVTPSHTDYLSQEFRRLYTKAGIDRPYGCGFSWLRHTFYTVATRNRDTVSRDLIMGHAAAGMSDHYLENHDLDPVRQTTDFVRDWLGLESVDLPFNLTTAKRGTRRGA